MKTVYEIKNDGRIVEDKIGTFCENHPKIAEVLFFVLFFGGWILGSIIESSL